MSSHLDIVIPQFPLPERKQVIRQRYHRLNSQLETDLTPPDFHIGPSMHRRHQEHRRSLLCTDFKKQEVVEQRKDKKQILAQKLES